MEIFFFFSPLQFSRSVVSDSLRPHGLQHTRPPCPSPTPGACSNSCPSSQWCHPSISSSVVPFSSHLQSFPALGSFQMNQFFASGGQSFSFFVSPSNEYSVLISWFDLLAVQGTRKSLLQHHSSKVYRINRSLFFSCEKKSKQWEHPETCVGSHCTVSRPAAFMESWDTHCVAMVGKGVWLLMNCEQCYKVEGKMIFEARILGWCILDAAPWESSLTSLLSASQSSCVYNTIMATIISISLTPFKR